MNQPVNFKDNLINWRGMWTLYLREVKRFIKVYQQTIIAPSLSALIFFSIFVIALSDVNKNVNGIKYEQFMAYGLIIMTIIQNAFANTSSSLIMSKVIGYIIDILTPPLSSMEIILAYLFGALTRAVVNGIILSILFYLFIEFSIHSIFYLFYFTIISSSLMALLGIFAGIYASSFDQSSIILNYIINPLSFLSGTFYSVKKLPIFFQNVNLANPFYYIIDGFRYSLTGYSESNIQFGVIYLTTLTIVVFFILKKLIDIGWRIKS